jgi:hypothetical protein
MLHPDGMHCFEEKDKETDSVAALQRLDLLRGFLFQNAALKTPVPKVHLVWLRLIVLFNADDDLACQYGAL